MIIDQRGFEEDNGCADEIFGEIGETGLSLSLEKSSLGRLVMFYLDGDRLPIVIAIRTGAVEEDDSFPVPFYLSQLFLEETQGKGEGDK